MLEYHHIFDFVRERARRWHMYALLVLVALAVLYYFFLSAPRTFPVGGLVRLEKGETLSQVAVELKNRRIVRSAGVFRMVAIILGGERAIQAGDYALPTKQNVFSIASRVVHGVYDIEVFKITIPEGFTNKQVSALFDYHFTRFNHSEFLRLAKQGYVFPDTYFFQATTVASSTVELIDENFQKKIAPLVPRILVSGRDPKDVITMASIIQKETHNADDMATVSGILWKRLDLGMKLQVDSAAITYQKAGLPAEPICNPGLDALEAAVSPKSSPYLYFINGSDKDHTIHYAKTLDEQTANIRKYLK